MPNSSSKPIYYPVLHAKAPGRAKVSHSRARAGHLQDSPRDGTLTAVSGIPNRNAVAALSRPLRMPSRRNPISIIAEVHSRRIYSLPGLSIEAFSHGW